MKTKDLEEENLHVGHRQRLTDTILNSGIENVSQIQAVEFFLTYIFPRGDVNPLAHRLLDRYKSFGNIVDADVEDLKYIDGINDRSAKKIKLFGEMIFFYSLSKMKKKVSLKNTNEFLDYVEQMLRFKDTENLILFAIDTSFNLLQTKKFDLKSVRQVGIEPLEIYTFIKSSKPSYLAVAHNHPNGTAYSSPDDADAYKFLETILNTVNCKIIDSIVIGKDGIYSEKQQAFLRHFEDIDALLDMFN